MRKIIKGISALFIIMLILALLGKYIPFNTTTPFFKWYMPYISQVGLEIVLLIASVLVVLAVLSQRKLRMKIAKKILIFLQEEDFKRQKRKFLIIYSILNIVVVALLAASPGWDYGTIVYDLGKLFQYKSLGIREYMMQYPNNLLYLFCVLPFVLFFGPDITVAITIAINILLIIFTFSLFMDIVYKISGSLSRMKYASFVFILFLPLLYYNQTFYTDTIVFPLILGSVLLLFEAEGNLTNSRKKLWQGFGLLSVAAIFKPSMLVVVIAISIMCLLFYKKWAKLYAFSFVGVLIVVKVAMLGLISVWSLFYPPLYNKAINEVGYPESAWICMAQNDKARGDYNEADAKKANEIYAKSNKTKKEMSAEMKKCIEERIAARGVKGNLDFFFRKFAFSWSDSTYYSVYNLGLISATPGNKMQYTDVHTLKKNSSVTKLNLYLEQGWLALIHYSYLDMYQNILYLVAIVVTIQQFFRKKKSPRAFAQFVVLALLGFCAFHLIWEARSRYALTAVLLLLLYVFIYLRPIKLNKQKDT